MGTIASKASALFAKRKEYPDFFVDVKREQELLLSHDIIVFQHPFYWYSGPALLKQWEDLVLQYGFAYGAQGTKLNGKWALTAITTGSSSSTYQRDGYNYFTIRELLTPFEQTVRFCGMRCLPPFVINGTLAGGSRRGRRDARGGIRRRDDVVPGWP